METAPQSEIPPPISSIIVPVGEFTSYPAPKAASFPQGCNIISLAPIFLKTSINAFFSTFVIWFGADT